MFKGSMVAIVKPMNEDGSLDHISLENLIEFHIENKTDVIISVGTTGESATLDFDEHSEVIKSTLDIVNISSSGFSFFSPMAYSCFLILPH